MSFQLLYSEPLPDKSGCSSTSSGARCGGWNASLVRLSDHVLLTIYPGKTRDRLGGTLEELEEVDVERGGLGYSAEDPTLTPNPNSWKPKMAHLN